MIPYTIEAVHLIRASINRGMMPAEVRRSLGWTDSMFQRVCVKHGISLVYIPAVAAPPEPTPPSPPVVEKPQRAPAPVRCQTTFAVSADVHRRLLRLAAQKQLAPTRMASLIVEEAVAAGQLSTIELIPRTARGTGDGHIEFVTVSVVVSVMDALQSESDRRKHNGERCSPGLLAKAIVVSALTPGRISASASIPRNQGAGNDALPRQADLPPFSRLSTGPKGKCTLVGLGPRGSKGSQI